MLGRSLIFSKNNRVQERIPEVLHKWLRENQIYDHWYIQMIKVLYWTDTIETSHRLYLLLHIDSIKTPQPNSLLSVELRIDSVMISWALLHRAKLKWVKNVIIFKITIKALKHSLFKNFTRNRQGWYWPIVIFVLPRAFLKNWGNFKFIRKNAAEKRIVI